MRLIMDEIINIYTGEVKIGSINDTLASNGIGSCIDVAAINLESQTAGMAHIMLPGRAPAKACKNKTKYAEHAIDKLLNSLEIKKMILLK